MERNFTKARLAARRTPTAETRWRWFLWVGITVLVICTMGFCTFIYKHFSSDLVSANGIFSSFGGWLEERKNNLQHSQGKPNVKHLAVEQENTEPQIHFEFYNALPEMKVNTTEPLPQPVMVNKPIMAKESAKKPLVKRTPQLAHVTPQKSQAKARLVQESKLASKTTAKPTPFGLVVSAEELERELSDQLKQKQYIIQLGMFRDSAAAKRYRKVLSRAGLSVTVVKIKEGNKGAYRIQQGPFINVHRAKSAQKSLQKRGIASLVVRMNQG